MHLLLLEGKKYAESHSIALRYFIDKFHARVGYGLCLRVRGV
jgi:hypothetical protein